MARRWTFLISRQIYGPLGERSLPVGLDRPPCVQGAASRRLHTLPPTLVLTAEHDPLRDEGEELATRLADLGVQAVGMRVLGQLHGFLRHPEVYDASEPVVRTIAGFVRQHC